MLQLTSIDKRDDEFCDAFAILIRGMKDADIAVVVGDFDAEVGKFSASEPYLGGR